ncbi:hypothetical protein BGZ83_009763 [Gryganskiella cystojenkinii]|nr:hypothetical protein BGZ83_009763 [Gryganskiella cystojenkinii]
MGFTFDIELHTAEPFQVQLDLHQRRAQTLSGAIVFQLDAPETFKTATISIVGNIGVALNLDTSKHSIVRERLLETSVDLIAANDTEGHGTIRFEEAGKQYLPFRIDLPRPWELPPTLLNKLDTHYIDWKYEIVGTVQRDFIFSTSSTVKHDLAMQRPMASLGRPHEPTVSVSTDMPKNFRSKITIPSRIALGEDRLRATIEMKARNKGFMVKEVDCSIVQTEDICYFTRYPHPSVANAHEPGVPCKVNASRLVSAIKRLTNDENDLDFGRHKALELDLHLDNFQLIPTERGLGWIEISHVLKFTTHFMDVNLEPIVHELPLFVDHEPTPSSIAEAERIASAEVAARKEEERVATAKKSSTLRMLESLTLSSSTVSPVS